MVERDGFENHYIRKGIVSSNLTLAVLAKFMPLALNFDNMGEIRRAFESRAWRGMKGSASEAGNLTLAAKTIFYRHDPIDRE